MEQVRINPGPEELQKYEWSRWRVSNSRPCQGNMNQIVEGAKHKECSGMTTASVPKA